MKKKNWLILALCSTLAMGAVACSDDSGSDNSNNGGSEEPEKGEASISVTSSVAMKAGGEGKISAIYKVGDSAKDGVKISAVSDNTKCVKVEDDMLTTLNGKAEFILNAQDVKDDCTATITVFASDDSNIKAYSSARVTGNGGSGSGGGGGEIVIDKDPVIQFVEPTKCSGSSICSQKAMISEGSMTAKVKYLDKNGKPVEGTTITVTSSDSTCAAAKFNTLETDAAGDASAKIEYKKTDCSTLITFSNGKAEATLNVEVGESPTYNVNLEFNYVNAGSSNKDEVGIRIGDVQNVTYGSYKGTECPSIQTKADVAQLSLQTGANFTSFASTNPIKKKSLAINKKNDTVNGNAIIVAWAEDGNEEVLASGCISGITVDDADKTKELFLQEIPIRFHNEYTIISNFDFTSGFSKTSRTDGSYPKAESMLAGDWIQFVVNLFDNPVNELLEFIWANTLDRLIGMLGDEGWQKTVKGFLNEGTKQIAITALKPMIENFLKDYDWYKYTTYIAKDIADIASNMQLKGTIKAGEFEDMLLSGFKTDFNEIQYLVTDNWNIKTKTIKCIETDGDNMTYVEEGKCRHALSLDKDAVTSVWNGTVNYTPSKGTVPEGEAYLDINASSFEFKWGQILYAAIFGDILPIVFDYTVDKDNSGNKLYLKSFLNKIAFEPVVDFYVNNKQGTMSNPDVEGGAAVYPPLTIPAVNASTGANQACNRFIESLLYMVWPSINDTLSSFGSAIIQTIAKFACEDGMGKLDDLVAAQLNKLVLNTANGMSLASTDCTLHAKGNYYNMMGEADKSHIGANTYLNNEGVANTKRCIWDLKYDTNTTVHGLFHAVENDLD